MSTSMQQFNTMHQQDLHLMSLIQHLSRSQLVRLGDLINKATGTHEVITINEMDVKEHLAEQNVAMPSKESIQQACEYISQRSTYQDTQWYSYIRDAAEHALGLEEVNHD
jgi:hypothetical protein